MTYTSGSHDSLNVDLAEELKNYAAKVYISEAALFQALPLNDLEPRSCEIGLWCNCGRQEAY